MRRLCTYKTRSRNVASSIYGTRRKDPITSFKVALIACECRIEGLAKNQLSVQVQEKIQVSVQVKEKILSETIRSLRM